MSEFYIDFVVVIGLSIILCFLLRILKNLSNKWKLKMSNRIQKALDLRKKVKDKFRNTYGYSWDYVIIFKILKIKQSKQLNKTIYKNKSDIEGYKYNSIKFIIIRLSDSGLQNKLYYSIQKDEVYCKIRCPLNRLKEEAERIKYRLLLEPNCINLTLQMGNEIGPKEKQWKGIYIDNSYTIKNDNKIPIEPFEYIYFEYKESIQDNNTIYKIYNNNSIFKGTDRIKLIESIMISKIHHRGAGINIHKLIKDHACLACFPLHDAVELKLLENEWLAMLELPWKTKIDPVKDYFGEKIGLFFLFLGHYTTWLIPSALASIFFWSFVASAGNDPNVPEIIFFSIYVSIWGTLFLEYWKRKEKLYAMKWGMIGYEDGMQQDRPEFEGEPSHHPVDGRSYLHFPHKTYFFRQGVSYITIFILIIIVLIVIIGLFVIRILLENRFTFYGIALGPILVGLIMAVQIQVLNLLYEMIAIKLNDYENHRTDTQYEDSLIGKTFLFQFINSFANMFYIAFVKPYIPTIDPCYPSCLQTLQTSLGTIFLTRLALGSTLKLFIPFVKEKINALMESKGVDPDLITDVERQYIQAEYHVLLGPFTDYANLAIQFGYSTMFIVAYPLAMVMSFVANFIELKVDAWKLTHLTRRPIPRSCEDIGTWYAIFEFISIISVITNSALVSFTGEFLQEFTYLTRIWIFMAMCSFLLLCKKLISDYIPLESSEVKIQIERMKYYKSKVIDNMPDDDDDDDNSNIVNHDMQSNIKFTIRINDDDPM